MLSDGTVLTGDAPMEKLLKQKRRRRHGRCTRTEDLIRLLCCFEMSRENQAEKCVRNFKVA